MSDQNEAPEPEVPKNEQVALKLGWEQLDTERYEYPWRDSDGEGHYDCLDYEHDIAAAMTLESHLPVGWWVCSPNREGAPWVLFWMDNKGEDWREAATLSAAIVDAFLAAEGGK